jgi:hypothetical protein
MKTDPVNGDYFQWEYRGLKFRVYPKPATDAKEIVAIFDEDNGNHTQTYGGYQVCGKQYSRQEAADRALAFYRGRDARTP